VACGALAFGAGPAAADPVLAAAGDIACGSGTTDGVCQAQSTANLLATINPTAVVTLGDDQYESGSLSDFNSYYGPTWGQWKAITRPSAGNHEYYTSAATGYFDYFDGQGNATGLAGDRGKGYYSWDLGSWHLVALNSNCASIGGCAAGSPQEQWLRADLAAHPASCTLAYMHHPRWSSDSVVGSTTEVGPLVQALYDNHADVMLAGHAHTYERFAPQSPSGAYDPNGGLAEIIAGTGGKSEFAFNSTFLANSMVRADTLGVLKLALHASSYDWQFMPASGQTFSDAGTAMCHGRQSTPPPPPPQPPPATTPAAVTGTASGVTRSSAILGGQVNPNGQPTTYRFEYGSTSSYGSVTPSVSAGSASGAVAVSQGVSGLAKNTTYHFRLVASWSTGATSRGADASFRTPPH
jgi:hypothetical protein